jgi:hypothetical protein
MQASQALIEWVKVAATIIASFVAAWVSIKIGRAQRDIAAQQAAIADEQRKIAGAKLNLELFEQRYAIFETVWRFLSDALEDHADRFPNPLRPEFTNMIPKARFLFGDSIAEYMVEASQKRVALWTVLRMQQRQGGNPMFEGQTVADLQIWFSNESTKCFQRFGDYLDFSAWKRPEATQQRAESHR